MNKPEMYSEFLDLVKTDLTRTQFSNESEKPSKNLKLVKTILTSIKTDLALNYKMIELWETDLVRYTSLNFSVLVSTYSNSFSQNLKCLRALFESDMFASEIDACAQREKTIHSSNANYRIRLRLSALTLLTSYQEFEKLVQQFIEHIEIEKKYGLAGTVDFDKRTGFYKLQAKELKEFLDDFSDVFSHLVLGTQ